MLTSVLQIESFRKIMIKYALLTGRPWKGASELVAHHMESPGTKAYTHAELRALFGEFRSCETRSILTPYDTANLPNWLTGLLPQRCGWFIAVTARK